VVIIDIMVWLFLIDIMVIYSFDDREANTVAL